MSRTNHKSKGPGFEYWKSRLHKGGELPGRYTKTLTHKLERRKKQEELEERKSDLDGLDPGNS